MSSTSEPIGLPADAASGWKWSREARVIAMIAVVHFTSHVHIMLLPPLFGEVREAFGVSYIQIGLALCPGGEQLEPARVEAAVQAGQELH